MQENYTKCIGLECRDSVCSYLTRCDNVLGLECRDYSVACWDCRWWSWWRGTPRWITSTTCWTPRSAPRRARSWTSARTPVPSCTSRPGASHHWTCTPSCMAHTPNSTVLYHTINSTVMLHTKLYSTVPLYCKSVVPYIC